MRFIGWLILACLMVSFTACADMQVAQTYGANEELVYTEYVFSGDLPEILVEPLTNNNLEKEAVVCGALIEAPAMSIIIPGENGHTAV